MSLAALGITAAGALGQYALNQRSQKKAFQQNVDFWKQKFDETNKYNSPVQQVARLKEAGLNPAMMYGQSASGATGTAGTQSSDGRKAAQLTGLDNLGLMSSQAANIQQDTKLKAQDTALRGIQAGTELARKAKTQAEATTARSLADTSRDLMRYQLDKAQAEAWLSDSKAYVQDQTKRAQINAIISDARLKAANLQSVKNQNEVYLETRKKLVKMGIDPNIVVPMLNAIMPRINIKR